MIQLCYKPAIKLFKRGADKIIIFSSVFFQFCSNIFLIVDHINHPFICAFGFVDLFYNEKGGFSIKFFLILIKFQ